jgi:hypothetical protein
VLFRLDALHLYSLTHPPLLSTPLALLPPLAYVQVIGLELSEEVLDPQFLEFIVHCQSDTSIGHLHIHCCLKNLWTTNGEALASTNLLVRDVMQVLRDEHENGWMGRDEFRIMREEFQKTKPCKHIRRYERREIDGQGVLDALEKDDGVAREEREAFAQLADPKNGRRLCIFTHYTESKAAPQPQVRCAMSPSCIRCAMSPSFIRCAMSPSCIRCTISFSSLLMLR